VGDVAFHTATTVDEALSLIGDGSSAKVVAGGSDLIVQARGGRELPANVVAIHRIDALRGIDASGDLTLGALVTHAEITASAAVRSTWTALADASAIVGSHATRNVGTIGGNVMNASPAMETGAPLIVLGATATLRSGAGDRSVPVEELWTGPGRTSAQPGELLVDVSMPALPAHSGSAYVRLEYRRAMEIAIVGASACVTLDGDAITAAKVALTAVGPTLLRSPAAEAAIIGTRGDAAALEAVAAGASDDASPISDLRAKEDYRRAMIGVIAKRAVDVAVRRARGEEFPIPATPVFMEGSAR
jgi:CO/xanthine dehydrogenase FAD-binding subunit